MEQEATSNLSGVSGWLLWLLARPTAEDVFFLVAVANPDLASSVQGHSDPVALVRSGPEWRVMASGHRFLET